MGNFCGNVQIGQNDDWSRKIGQKIDQSDLLRALERSGGEYTYMKPTKTWLQIDQEYWKIVEVEIKS